MRLEEIQMDNMIEELGSMIGKQEKNRSLLVHALQRIQQECGYLPVEELRELSSALSISPADIYSVASFYKMFHFKPRGRKIVKVCLGTACYVRGSNLVLHALEDKFKIMDGETTDDLAMTLETVGCVGCCGLAPVATCNEEVIGEIDAMKMQELIQAIEEERQILFSTNSVHGGRAELSGKSQGSNT